MHRLLLLVGSVGALAAADTFITADSVTADFAAGSFVRANEPLPIAGPAVSETLDLIDATTGANAIRTHRIKLAAAPQSVVLARSYAQVTPNGAAGGELFAYKNGTWQFTVPFAISDATADAEFVPRVFTPKFNDGSVRLYTVGSDTDDGATEEDSVAGEYKDGLFIDVADPQAMTIIGEWSFQNNPANANNIQIRENGVLVGRTNGGVNIGTDQLTVERVAVVEARVAVVDDGSGKALNVYEEVPFVLTKDNRDAANPYRLVTPRNNGGSVKLLDFIVLDELDASLPVGNA
jgi:hypothetical protein